MLWNQAITYGNSYCLLALLDRSSSYCANELGLTDGFVHLFCIYNIMYLLRFDFNTSELYENVDHLKICQIFAAVSVKMIG